MAEVGRVDPIGQFRFGIDIDGAIVGWFTECSQLTVEREVKSHPEGGVNDYVHQLPGPVKRLNVTLKHGLANSQLWNWLQHGVYNGQVAPKNISIVLYNTDLTEAKRWDLLNVYPTKWSGSNFNTANNEAVLETLELCQSGNDGSTGAANGTVQRMGFEVASPQDTPAEQELDLPTLAKAVYALLKQDLRVEQERLGRNKCR